MNLAAVHPLNSIEHDEESPMKVHIEYDQQGNIKAIAVLASGGQKRGMLKASAGHSIAEVDFPDGKHPGDLDHLKEIRQRYRVEPHGGGHRLAEK
ncbi:hypothetical protein [Paraburkholderia sp. BR14374]